MSLRKPSYIATWHVQGLAMGKLAIIEKEIEWCKKNILGFAESWWLGKGKFTTEHKNMMMESRKVERVAV